MKLLFVRAQIGLLNMTIYYPLEIDESISVDTEPLRMDEFAD